MTTILTWGQRPDESAPAYEAFKVYRNSGARRSLRSTAREVGKARTLMDRWSSRHQWVARCAAWDQEQVELRKEARFVAVADAEARHTKLARAVLGRVAAELGKEARATCQRCGRGPTQMTAAQVAAWLKAGVEVERLALGLGGGHGITVATQVNVAGGSGPATGATALVLLRDPSTQELAADLLARMRALDPGKVGGRLASSNGGGGANGAGGQGGEVVTVEAVAVRTAEKIEATGNGGANTPGPTRRLLAGQAVAELVEEAEAPAARHPRPELPDPAAELGGGDEVEDPEDEGDLF